MRAVVQCVSEASVTVEGRVVGAIGKGYAILLGVGHGDTEAEAERLWRKIAKMRVFEDAQGKTNLSLADVGGEVLVVSQFTLYANCRKGNRPSFTDAAEPAIARRLYEHFAAMAILYKKQKGKIINFTPTKTIYLILIYLAQYQLYVQF